jgi:tetratricopeptide (TPR) repeat protein
MRLRSCGMGVALVILLCGLVMAGCGGADARRANHMERGRNYLAAGNLPKAQVEFRNALQIAPNNPDARFMSGQVAERLGNLRDAVGLYQAAIEVAPGDVQYRVALARLYVFAGAPKRALELIQPALLQHPDNADLLTVRGAASAESNDRANALADAERAVSLEPENIGAVALLASLYRQTGASERAVALVSATLAKVPSSIDLRQILVSLYLQLERPGLAEEQLRGIVRLRPQELSYRYQLALLYAREKKPDAADHVLQDAIAALPDRDEPKLAYAQFLAQQRSPAEGERALEQFIARAPRELDLQLGLGALQQRDGNLAGALKTYRHVVAEASERPQGLEARDHLAAILAQQGHLDEALPLVSDVLHRNPRDSDALMIRGNIALARNDPAAAISDLRAVLRDQPRSVAVMHALARAHLLNGEPALAEETLHSAIDAAPKDTSLKIELARLLSQSNRMDAAAALLDEAARAAPDDLAVRDAQIRVYLSKRDLVAARKAADDLKSRAPDQAVSFYLSGLVAQARAQPDEAAREFEHALSLKPDALDALVALARLDSEGGRPEAAIARVASVVTAQPANPVLHNLLGELYLAAKQYPQSVEQLTRATQLAPRWWLPYRSLAVAQESAGDALGAMRTYEHAETAAGLQAPLVTDLAGLYEHQGRIDDAIRQYEALYRTNPRLKVAANNLAMLLVTYKTDRASLDRARDLTAGFAESGDAALIDTDGWVQLKRGEVAQALPLLERAAERAPTSNVIRYHLGMAQLRSGQPEKARSTLQSAVQGAQNFSGIEDARTALAQIQGHAG